VRAQVGSEIKITLDSPRAILTIPTKMPLRGFGVVALAKKFPDRSMVDLRSWWS
jgi:hypothetical protein